MESLKKEDWEISSLNWLRSLDFNIDSLELGRWVKGRGIGETAPTGSFAYRVFINQLNNGNQGVIVLAKVHGKEYRYNPLEECNSIPLFLGFPPSPTEDSESNYLDAARRVAGFWNLSSSTGLSDYLTRKGVGSHGIRFRDNEHGRVAIVPMRDIAGYLWSCQYLNPNGSKVFFRGGKTLGMFHALAPIIDGKIFGIAESYVTAATCYELTGIPTLCAFRCNNLVHVAEALNAKFPTSPVILFADNDRHLQTNEGILCANKACKVLGSRSVMAFPDIEAPPGRDASDWNDLVRLHGKNCAIEQINTTLRQLEHDPHQIAQQQ